MSKLFLKWFGGMRPRMGEQHLQGENRLEETGYFRRPQVNPNFDIETGVWATEAENCNLYSGELRPLHKPALAYSFCRPSDACWHVPIPDDPSVPPPPPPPPPPMCVPVALAPVVPPEPTAVVIYLDANSGSGRVQSGYGQDRNINVGATETEMLINPLGHGPLQYTDDGGATWTPISWSQDNSTRICQDMIKIGTTWWVLGYRPDNTADRSWKSTTTPPGGWVFTNDQTLSYNHGVAYLDEDTFWRWDQSAVGSPSVMRKYTNQVTGTPATFTGQDDANPRHGWIHRKVGDELYVSLVYQGGVDTYEVWDISADIPVRVGLWDTSVNQARNMVTDGTSVICTATAGLGGTSGNDAIIQSLSNTGTVTDTLMDFGVPVDLVGCHYEGSQFIITAIEAGDFSLMRYGFGTSGTYSNIITLPYPASTLDDQRDVRYLGNGVYAIGYLAVVGGDNGVLVVFTVNL